MVVCGNSYIIMIMVIKAMRVFNYYKIRNKNLLQYELQKT